MMRAEVQRWTDSVVEELRKHVGDRLGSVILFGSGAGDGRLREGSDLDLLIVARDGVRIELSFLLAVASALTLAQEGIPIPLSPLIFSSDEASWLLSGDRKRMLASTARTLYGSDLIPQWRCASEHVSRREYQRGILRGMLFERQQLRSVVATRADVAYSDSDQRRRVLHSALSAARQAMWILTDSQENDFATVVSGIERELASFSGIGTPRRALSALEDGRCELGLLLEVVDFVERLTEHCREYFQQIEGTQDLWIDPRW